VSDNKILMTIELTPDDELVVRNAVTGEELDRTAPLDSTLVTTHALRRHVDVAISAVRGELVELLVEQNPVASERYT
jgi:hypothetical protein